MITKMMTYIRPPLVNHYRKKSEYQYKNKTRITHWTKECKNCPVQKYCSKKTTIQNNQRLWKTFPKKKNKNAKKNKKPQKPPPQKKSTKIRSKNNRNYHLQNMKQNIHLTKFTTTDLKQINTEFKLYTTKHNLKRTYNEINSRNN